MNAVKQRDRRADAEDRAKHPSSTVTDFLVYPHARGGYGVRVRGYGWSLSDRRRDAIERARVATEKRGRWWTQDEHWVHLHDAARAELRAGVRESSTALILGGAAVLAAGGVALLVLARPGGAVARARSAIGYGTVYALGAGGFDPSASLPSVDGKCDCSGFTAWVCGLDRRQPESALRAYNGGWLSTDGILWDAKNAREFFELADAPARGDLAVYGDYLGADGLQHQGHVGVVSRPAATWAGLKMVHCSLGNYRDRGDAIQETGAGFMGDRGAVFVRRTGVST